jgi:hypothetical protein
VSWLEYDADKKGLIENQLANAVIAKIQVLKPEACA